MRLHHLEITAFGPFAETVTVDFDDLSAAGVFLLTGATGAGKSSVLDAVCFALYGQVPGDRAGARHLRSDHAAPTVAPEVVLRASIGDRTFRFTRSPAWTRPKRRGTGETTVPAHVLVEELRDGGWVGLTNRLDEAGHLVGELLGMTATQFTQVALLPQGRFQAFLRASSTERHAVLQKLFRTDRFEQVERWLVDRRIASRRAADAAGASARSVLHRLQEAAGLEQLPEWAEDLEAAARRGEVAAWSATLLAEAERSHHAAAVAHHGSADALAVAEAALAEGRHADGLRRRAESAARTLVDLDARADELTDRRDRLAAHRRAAPVAPLVLRSRECRRRADDATARWHVVRTELGDVDGETRAAVASLHEQAVAARATAVAFRPRAEALDGARQREHQLAARLAALATATEAADLVTTGHPARLDEARRGLADAEAAQAGIAVLEHALATATELAAAVERLAALVTELAAARRDLAEAVTLAQVARDAYLDVREARINGMAAELAGGLAVGCACPVCGSAAHPSPASARPESVGRDEEDAARKAHEDAGFVQQGHELRVATLETEHAALSSRLDGVDLVGTEVTDARAALQAARVLAGAVPVRSRLVESLDRELTEARAQHEQLLQDRAAARQDLETTAALVATLDAELAELLGDAADLEELVAHRSACCAALERALAAYDAHADAVRAAAEAVEAAVTASADAGFPDDDAVLAAVLAVDEVEEAEARIASADAARLAAEQSLADPEVKAAVAAPAPDLDVLVVKQRLAADTARGSATALEVAATREQRLAVLDRELRARLDAWEPLRDAHDQVASLAQLVEGKGPDNPQRIRLAAYVLSERLRQVVAAANERLGRMTEGRYSLEHTDDRGAGEQRGGLSLLVSDDWSGVGRDPATLSGGETFVVSLALALGLADTVAHEAGGTDIDTLFIDEGFGSLDADTLEDVMDTLDTLRDGGRVVGVVSHVPEMRSRITTQLEVRKQRHGSTVHAVLAAG